MAALADKKVVSAPFSNEGELVRVVYDFAVDSGDIADYDVLVADGNLLVKFLNIDCKAAVTSGDAALIDLGKGAGGVEWMSDVEKASLAKDAQYPGSLSLLELADGEKIVLGIESHALTAGKLEFMFLVYSR